MKLPGFVLLLCGCLRSFSRLPVLQAEGRPLKSHRVYAAVHADAVLPCRAVTEAVPLSGVVLLEWLGPNGSEQILYVLVDGKKMKDQAEAYRDRTSLKEDGSLTLRDVRLSDSGEYRCVFQRGSGSSRLGATVALVVVQLSEPSLKVHRTRTNQLEVECESSCWGPQLRVSVLDARGDVLSDRTGPGSEAEVGPDVSVRVRVSAAGGSQTENMMFVCRAEVPEVQLRKENWIHITDDFTPAGPEGSDWALIGLVVFLVFLVLCVGFTCCIKRRWILDQMSGLHTGFQGRSSSHKGGPAEQLLLQHQTSPETTGEETEYRNLDQLTTTGPSEVTIRVNKLDKLDPPLSGVEASHHLAAEDLDRMSTYRDKIVDVGRQLHFHPALIAAIISKQSRAGAALKDTGFGFDGSSFGLMQINKAYHAAKGEPFSREHIDEGTTYLIHLIKSLKNRENTWTPERRLKGALVGYMMGIENVRPGSQEDLDHLTPTEDFASDVIARAQFFSKRGFRV